MRIVVVGAGGVGGYFGARLAAAGADVTFIARGRHLEALRSTGLRLVSPKGDLHLPRVAATGNPAEIGPADIVFFTVKLYDTDSAVQLLPPLIGPATIVVPFQNGVDSVDVLTEAVGREHVGGGVAYVAAVIDEPGVIRHTAMDHLIFGELDGSRSPRLQQLLEACARSGFQATLSESILSDIWSKYVRLTTFSGMTTVTRSPLGVVRTDPDLLAMLTSAARETLAVARAKGVPLGDKVFDEMMAMTMEIPGATKSSMLEDLERGRRLELPWLSGRVAALGKELGVPTPTHHFIATVLKPFVQGRD